MTPLHTETGQGCVRSSGGHRIDLPKRDSSPEYGAWSATASDLADLEVLVPAPARLSVVRSHGDRLHFDLCAERKSAGSVGHSRWKVVEIGERLAVDLVHGGVIGNISEGKMDMQSHPGPHRRQRHAVLADGHRGVGGPVVLGERTSRSTCGRPGSSGGHAPGRLHHVPRRDLAKPAQLGRALVPKRHLLQRSRQGRPLRGLGGARALLCRGACRFQVTSLEGRLT